MPKTIIDQEFAGLLPPHTKEERAGLEAEIEREGCRDPIVVWKGKGIVLDGMTRLIICQKKRKSFNVVELDLPSRAACLQWIIDHQLSRRNLTPERVSYLRGKDYLNQKRDTGRPDASENKCGQNVHINEGQDESHKYKRTVEALADKHGVNEKTIRRDAEFAEAVDQIAETQGEEAKAEILNGQAGTKSDIVKRASLEKEHKKSESQEKSPEPEKLLDDLDVEVPESLKTIFAEQAPRFKAIVNQLNAMNRELEELSKLPAGACLSLQGAQIDLRDLKESVRFARPYCVCPMCEGKANKPNCACKKNGCLTEASYKRLPMEYRQ